MNTDWVGLIDEWSGRFFAELDYEAEAASAMQFKREMAKLDGIVVPDVFLDLTTPYVLTTAWVEGVHSTLLPLTTFMSIITTSPPRLFFRVARVDDAIDEEHSITHSMD